MTSAEIDEAAEAMAPEARRVMLAIGEREMLRRGASPDEIDRWRVRFNHELDAGLVRKLAHGLARNVTHH